MKRANFFPIFLSKLYEIVLTLNQVTILLLIHMQPLYRRPVVNFQANVEKHFHKTERNKKPIIFSNLLQSRTNMKI